MGWPTTGNDIRCSKFLEGLRSCIIKLKKITGVISGTVTFINICHLEAPSIMAASYCDCGTFCNAAKKITMAEPNCHTRSNVTEVNASDGSPSQLIASNPKTPIKLLSKPSIANTRAIIRQSLRCCRGLMGYRMRYGRNRYPVI